MNPVPHCEFAARTASACTGRWWCRSSDHCRMRSPCSEYCRPFRAPIAPARSHRPRERRQHRAEQPPSPEHSWGAGENERRTQRLDTSARSWRGNPPPEQSAEVRQALARRRPDPRPRAGRDPRNRGAPPPPSFPPAPPSAPPPGWPPDPAGPEPPAAPSAAPAAPCGTSAPPSDESPALPPSHLVFSPSMRTRSQHLRRRPPGNDEREQAR